MVSDIFPSGPKYFQIQLQNDSFHSYVAGQTIIGRVVVELKDKLKIMALKIELLGKGKVHWTKEHYFVDRRSQGGSHFQPMPEEETYIYQKKYLIGERAESAVTLSPGVYSFPYFFTLSPWLPSSFEGRHCHIRYFLNATLERALFKDLKSEPLKFLIKGILDLNQYPIIARPINVTEHKNKDLLCWKLWAVSLNLNIERTGFVPGETLKFTVKFNNLCSNVKLTPVKAYLIQKITVKASRAKSSYEHTVLKIRGPVIEAGQVEDWEGSFQIPDVEPSGLGLYPSQVLRFNLQYYLQVTAKNVFATVSRKVGLTIGTIPWRENSANSVAGSRTNLTSEMVMFGGGQQFTPYQNLCDIFPPIAPATANNNESADAEGSATATSNLLNNMISNSVPNPSPLSESSQNELSTSLTILSDSAKTPLRRTDTPPPSYEEAIKKPAARK